MDRLLGPVLLIAGLTLAAIACGDGGADNTTTTPAPTPVPLGATAIPVPTDNTPCMPQTYAVQAGDTLSEIALRFDSTVESIVAATDGLSDADVLQVGQELTIPCPRDDADPDADLPDPGPSPSPASE